MAVFGITIKKGDLKRLVKEYNKSFNDPKPPYHFVEGRARILDPTTALFSFQNALSILDLPSYFIFNVLRIRWRSKGYKVGYLRRSKLIKHLEAVLWAKKKF